MTERSYDDLDLLIERVGEGTYRARILESPAGQARREFAWPFSDLELENLLLKIGRPTRGTRRLESPEMAASRSFGSRLFEAVFRDDVELCLRRSLDETERAERGLRIRLRLEDAPELANIPWEYLFNAAQDRFLALSSWTPIVRYLDLPRGVRPLAVTTPLRILVVVSSPSDYPALDVGREKTRLREAMADLVDRGLVELTIQEDANLLALQRQLRTGEFHVFHFVGHGGFDEAAADGVLMLEDTTGRAKIVAGRDLGTILSDHRSLRLAVLNACEGGRTSAADPFAGSAQSLVRQGVPAVVAMQFEITDQAAITFAHEFYRAISESWPVDASLAEARRAIFGMGNAVEWGTPVLYMRTPDGVIFRVERAPEADTAPEPVVPPGPAPRIEPAEEEPAVAVEPPPPAPPAPQPAPPPAPPAPEPPAPEPRATEPPSALPPPQPQPAPSAPEPPSPLPPPQPQPRREPVSVFVPPTDPARAPIDRPRPKRTKALLAGGVAALVVAGLIGFSVFGGDDGGEGDAVDDDVAEATEVLGQIVEAEGVEEAGAGEETREATDGQAIATPLGSGTSVVHRVPFTIFVAPEVANGSVNRLGDRSEAAITLGYDDSALRVQAAVVDDTHDQRNTGNQIFRGDAVNLNLAFGGSGGSAPAAPDAQTFQVTMSPGDPAAGTPVDSVIFQGNGQFFDANLVGQVVVSAEVSDGGFTLTGEIPWRVFGLSGPPSSPIGAIVTVFDNDGEDGGGRPLQTEILSNTPGAGFQQPQTWGRLTFE